MGEGISFFYYMIMSMTTVKFRPCLCSLPTLLASATGQAGQLLSLEACTNIIFSSPFFRLAAYVNSALSISSGMCVL